MYALCRRSEERARSGGRSAGGLKIGVDPMGGAAVHYWHPIAEMYGLDITEVNRLVDPILFIYDRGSDGKFRMDCSSPYAMAGLISMKDQFDLAFGNDPDVDRHGIVTPSAGLMGPNHFLATAIWYLFQHRLGWVTKCGNRQDTGLQFDD